MPDHTVKLKRNLGLSLITFYGLGNILGAGIYVLVGKVAGEAGYFAPFAFMLASMIAAVSAVTYAEMSSRYPVSAGEAVYINEGFGLPWLSIVVGVLIALSGMVSSAVISHGFAGYLRIFFDVPEWLIICVLFVVLCVLTIWGIKESARVAALLTLVEIAGLLLVIFTGVENIQLAEAITNYHGEITSGGFSFLGVIAGAFLAFYAYIGFEDMVNVAEEVKEPKKNMPRAILICVVVSTVLYAAVALVAVIHATPQELSTSAAPVAMVYELASGKEPVLISLIGIFAVVNGALIQMIMASRLLYGMAYKGWLPAPLSKVNRKTRTPVLSTVVTAGVMLFLALSMELKALASMTSYLVLTVFSLVNLALILIKRNKPEPDGVLVYSIWFPVFGFLSCIALIVLQLYSLL